MRPTTKFFLLALSISLLTSCFPDRSARKADTPQDKGEARVSTPSILGPAPTGIDVFGSKPSRSSYGKLPLYFEENRGQADDRVSFLARGAGYDFFLTPTETVMVFEKKEGEPNKSAKSLATSKQGAESATVIKDVVRMSFVGGNKKPAMAGNDLQAGRSSYFRGSDRNAWRTGIPHYSRVVYEEVYPGIDVVYYGSQNKLEYDFLVAPKSDASKIRLRLKGAKRLSLDGDGNLVVTTETGEFKQLRAVAYQDAESGRSQIATRYEIGRDNTVRILLDDYDREKELVIDPLIDYSTFLGGTGADVIEDIAIDSTGNAYLTGNTASTNFPTSSGAYRTTKSGTSDAFVLKLDPTGTSIVYSSFIGSTADDFGRSIAVDSTGNAYIAGETKANSYPTLNPRQSSYGGGTADCFLTKFNATGTGLVYSTFHGGSLADSCYGLTLDSSGNAYVVGRTESTNFPVLGAYQSTLTPDGAGGIGSVAIDAFVSKFGSAGNTLVYSTYLGGEEIDHANAIAVDSSGNAYVTGYTHSTTFDLVNAFQSTLEDFWLSGDAFVTKLNAAGNGLVYSTYLGGYQPDATPCFPSCIYFSNEEGNDIAVDSSGSAYVVGSTDSTDFPVANAYQWSIQSAQPNSDAFVTKFTPQGSSVVFSTYLGGNASDTAYGVALDAAGAVYVTGTTGSTNFPMSSAVQPSSAGGDEVFVTKFNGNGQSLAFSSYIGGGANEVANAVAVDSTGNIFVAGQTFSTNFPTSTPAQPVNAGAGDGFITKLTFAPGYEISGQVLKTDGSPAANVTITLSGGQSRQTTTSGTGFYSFPSLPSGRDYTITPSSGIYTFVPANQTITNLSANSTANFTVEVYTISGQVTDTTGAPVPLTRIDLTGSTTAAVLTDPNGNYAFINLPGGSYTLTPSKTDPVLTFTFTPPSYTFNSLLTSQTANFVVSSQVTTHISPLADAYVQDGTSTGQNFGTATTLKTETDTKTNNGKNFDTYFKFDLSTINRNIQTAKIRMTASSSTSGAVTTAAYSVAAVNWIESGAGSITWTNKPARGASPLTGSTTAVTGTTPAVYDIDVTNYIKAEKAAGRNLVSLALHNPTASTLIMTANSKEAATGKPTLVVTTTGFPNAAPAIAMTSPANGSSFTAPASVTVSANATDVDGTITRVDFYDGTTLIGNATSPVSGSTYSMTWSGVAAGSYVLTAVAFDNLGAQRMAAPVNITVNPGNMSPTVSITSPPTNTTIGAGSSIPITASADDPDGSITQVEFLYGSTSIGIDTTPSSGNSYSVNWNSIPTGVHSVTARATDNNGGITTSAPITIRGVGQVAYSPTADSYVQDGGSASTNFGTATDLRTQVAAGSNRETYLKFDITTATGIEKATLRLYGGLNDASGTNVQANVHSVATTTWVESGSGSITWNNKPAGGGSPLTSTTIVNNTDRWYELDLTSYIQAEKAAGRNVVSFVIKGAATSSPYIKFNSREATTNQPQLTMLTTQQRSVLFAVGSTTLVPGDLAVQNRLLALGYTVTLKVPGSNTNSAIKPVDADGKALVLVSSTVTAANVTNKLRNIPVPVINWEYDVGDDFGMTNTSSGVDFGTTSPTNQTQVVIANAGHAMSADLTGTVTVATSPGTPFAWGKPNANAAGIAVLTSDATRFAIYGYETGALMFGLPAPSRRVGFFFSDATANVLTSQGTSLFDAAVRWATRVETLPLISGISPSSGAIGTPVTITGANFGATQGTSIVTFNGTTATVGSWSPTSISTTVPNGATTGSVIVTINGFATNGFLFTVTTPNGDSDGDGLPDSWEMAYFGNLGYGANDDPDGDGVTNINEYLQGRNPTKGTVSNPSAVDLRVFTPLGP